LGYSAAPDAIVSAAALGLGRTGADDLLVRGDVAEAARPVLLNLLSRARRRKAHNKAPRPRRRQALAKGE